MSITDSINGKIIIYKIISAINNSKLSKSVRYDNNNGNRFKAQSEKEKKKWSYRLGDGNEQPENSFL